LLKKTLFKIVQEWPLKSELDPEIYGPPESAITSELLEAEIGGVTRVDKVIIPP
jgi:lipoxygenase